MKITKFGHSCLLIEEGEARILVDPGIWSEGYTHLTKLNAILITHEHQDHCDVGALASLQEKNPQATVLTNSDVGKKISEVGLVFELFEGGDERDIHGLHIEAIGHDHAIIYGKPPCQNTGYLFDGRLYHPGDSFHLPEQRVEVLALPVCAPWLKMSEVVDFAWALHPNVAFPIHDGMLRYAGPFHKFPQMALNEKSIEWKVLENGVPTDL